MNKKKHMIAIVFILLIGGLLTTFALVYFRSDVTAVTLKVEASLEKYINYVNGTPILGDSNTVLETGTSYLDGESTEIEFWKTPEAVNMDIKGYIYLNLDAISSNLANNAGFKWTVTSNNEILNEGDFIGCQQGDKITILNIDDLSTVQTKYQIHIWLDENEITTDVSGETFTLIVSCEATD